MLKKVLLALAVLLVTFGVVSYAVWYSSASNAKKEIEQALAALNTPNSTATYEAITVSGFPSDLNISIVKPHITGRINKLLSSDITKQIFHTNELPEWNEDYALDGNIDLSSNIFSNKYKLVIHGNFSGNGSVAGKQNATSGESLGDSVCELQLQKSPAVMLKNMWGFKTSAANGADLWKNFSSFECTTAKKDVVDSNTKEVLFSHAGFKIAVSKKSQNGTVDARFNLKITDSEITKLGDALYVSYMKALFPSNIPSSLSALGKQNMEIEISYNGSEDLTNPEAKNMPLDLKINKFSISNAAYQYNANVSITSNVKDGVGNASVTIKNELTANGDLLRNSTADTIINIVNDSLNDSTPDASTNAKIAKFKEQISKFKPNELEAMALSITPDFASLGKIVFDFDANYSGDNTFSNGKVTISDLELSTTPYGISAKSSLIFKEHAMPSGNISIACNNCMKMIDDGAAYLKNFSSTLTKIAPENKDDFEFPAEKVQGTKKFLLAIAPANVPENMKEQTNLTFEIVSSGMGEPTVNGKSMSEVINLFKTSYGMPKK